MKLIFIFFLLILVIPTIWGQLVAKELTITSDEQHSSAYQFFYKNKESTVVIALMRYENDMMDREEVKDNESFIPMSIYFYSEVFKRYPEKASTWIEEVSKLSNKRWRSVIIVSLLSSGIPNALELISNKEKQLEVSKDDINKLINISESVINPSTIVPYEPVDNDILWAAFFASGNEEYIRILIDTACKYNEQEDLNMFLTAGTAKWSLGANADKHKIVGKTLKKEAKRRVGEEKDILVDILNKSKSEQGIKRLAWDYQLVAINIQERIEWDEKFSSLSQYIKTPISGEYKPFVIKDLSTYIQKITNSVAELESYRSIVILRDLEFQENKWPNNEIITWKIKYQKPNIFHIWQSVILEQYPSGGIDIWVLNDSKMADKYMFDWFPVIEENDVPRSNINSFIRLNKYIDIINNKSPDDIQELTDEQNNYFHILSYSFSPSDIFGPFKVNLLRKELVESLFHIAWQIDDNNATPMILPLTSNKKVNHSLLINHLESFSNDDFRCTLQLFLWPDSHLIRGARLELDGKLKNSNFPVSLRIDTIFGDYNAELYIPHIE